MGELATVGLDYIREQVYRALVSSPDRTVDDLHAHLPAALRPRLAETVAALVADGLVTVRPGEPPRYTAVAPDVALDALVAGRAAALSATRRAIADLADRYRDRHARPDPDRVVEEVVGDSAVAHRFAQLHLLARVEVRRMDTTAAPVPALPPGVNRRTVLTAADPTDPGVRVTAAVPARMLLCDERFALVRTQADKALLVRQSALIRALGALFESVWDGARPAAAGTNEPAAEDRQILALLATGATDETIGRRVGTSTRTVRRRIHDLMNRTGVTTRLQLGLEASRRGWV